MAPADKVCCRVSTQRGRYKVIPRFEGKRKSGLGSLTYKMNQHTSIHEIAFELTEGELDRLLTFLNNNKLAYYMEPPCEYSTLEELEAVYEDK